MTQILTSHLAHVQEVRNLTLIAQGAIRETNAARKQLSGIKQLTNELHQTQKDVLHYKDRANQYELALLRTEAYLKKVKNANWEKEMENMGLKDRVKSLEEERTDLSEGRAVHHSEAVITDMADGSELEIDSAPIGDDDEEASGGYLRQYQHRVHNKKEIETRDMGMQATPSPEDIAASIPKHKYDNVMRNNVRLQLAVQDLSKENGLHFKNVLQQSEYEDQIRQLRKELQTRSEELQHLKREIHQAKLGHDNATKLLATQLQLEKVSKANEMKQTINEALSDHIEKLSKALKHSRMELEYEKYKHRGSAGIIRVNKQTSTEPEQAKPSGGDEPDGEEVAKRPTPKDKADGAHIDDKSEQTTDVAPTKRPQWQENEIIEKLKQQVKHLTDKNEKMNVDCKNLLTDKVMAIRDKEVYVTRYNDLMETVKQSTNLSPTTCSNCREFEKRLKKMEEELHAMKGKIENVTAQKDMFEEDLKQERVDGEQNKEKYTAQLERWRKNCVTLGKQVHLLTGDIEKERKKNQILEQQMSLANQQVRQVARMKSQSHPFSTMQPYQSLCATEVGPVVTPFQAGYVPRQGILAGGADEWDGKAQDGENTDKNECPRCKREFDKQEEDEYQKHMERCLNSS